MSLRMGRPLTPCRHPSDRVFEASISGSWTGTASRRSALGSWSRSGEKELGEKVKGHGRHMEDGRGCFYMLLPVTEVGTKSRFLMVHWREGDLW